MISNGKPSPTSAAFAGAYKSGTSTTFPAKRLNGTVAAPSAASQSANSDAAKAPKKGSIAEIRARAAAQQQKLQGIGKIQHKATEKPLTKKEREEAAAEELRLQKKGLKSGAKPGSTGPVSKNGSNGLYRGTNGHIDRERGAIQKTSTSGRPGKSAPAEEPKRKKAALATTGYTGSARPVTNKAKPGSSKPGPSSRGREPDRNGRPNPMGMFSKPRRRHEDDYDEDMDDFVVDDEEEEDYGGYGSRYKYADEDDDSDMEAGFSDVEDEEATATRMAILDDKREQQLEEQLRKEKEARKRRLLAGRR